MERMEFIHYLLGNIFYGLMILGFVWYIISLIRIWLYERKINKLYKELETGINKERQRKAPMAFIEGAIKKLKEDYEAKIEESKRKRRFILDKLPFVK